MPPVFDTDFFAVFEYCFLGFLIPADDFLAVFLVRAIVALLFFSPFIASGIEDLVLQDFIGGIFY